MLCETAGHGWRSKVLMPFFFSTTWVFLCTLRVLFHKLHACNNDCSAKSYFGRGCYWLNTWPATVWNIKPANSSKIAFWHDRCCLQILLKTKANDKDARVSDCWERLRWRWNSTVLFELEIVRVRLLKQFLNDRTPSFLEEDKPIWRWEKDGDFMVKSTYRHFINGRVTSVNTNWVWRKKCPQKLRLFLWKEALLTWPKLQKKEDVVALIYVFCVRRMENQLIILFLTVLFPTVPGTCVQGPSD